MSDEETKNSMTDFFHSMFDAAKERLKNPLMSTYVLFLLTWNWRPIYYVLYDLDRFLVKISRVNILFKWYDFAIPAIITIAYLAVIPFLLLWFDKSIGTIISTRKTDQFDRLAEESKKKRAYLEAQHDEGLSRSGAKTLKDLADHIENLENENKLLEKNSDQNYLTVQSLEEDRAKLKKESDRNDNLRVKEIKVLTDKNEVEIKRLVKELDQLKTDKVSR